MKRSMLVLAIAACAAIATPSKTAARLSDLIETTQAQPNYAQYYYGPYRRHVRRVYRRAYRRAYYGYPYSYGGYYGGYYPYSHLGYYRPSYSVVLLGCACSDRRGALMVRLAEQIRAGHQPQDH